MPAAFPEPDEYGHEITRRLTQRIRDELQVTGWLGFEQFMQCALYEPELGYYRNGREKFGADGDFVTAPELSNVFADTLASEIAGILASLRDPVILEIGAGSGRLAVDLTRALSDRSAGARYWILEPSADLKTRQQELLAGAGVQARWLERLPEAPFQGVILANEVLDAFPVTRFVKRDGETRPLGVCWESGGFVWAEGEPDPGLSDSVLALETRLGRSLAEGFRSEVSATIPAWIQSLSATLERGALLIVDYGLNEREYYHPQRNDGTLACHYRHRFHCDPFLFPGLQDISAWVDFSACARAARAAGLEVAGFTTQGQFLIAAGAAQRLGHLEGREALRAAQAFKTLVLPGEMGERFKILLLSRDFEPRRLPGRDFREWL